MKKQLIIIFLAGSLTTLLTGCASTSNLFSDLRGTNSEQTALENDQTRTRVEGTLLGAATGAVIGNLIGDNTKSTLLGAAIGGGVGYLVGDEVAKRKKAYATQEDLIENESKRTANLVDEVKQINQKLNSEIKSMQTQVALLATQEKQGKVQKAALEASKARVNQRYSETKQALEAVNKEIEIADSLYQDSKTQNKNASKLKTWENRINALKQEKVALQKHTNQLEVVSQAINL